MREDLKKKYDELLKKQKRKDKDERTREELLADMERARRCMRSKAKYVVKFPSIADAVEEVGAIQDRFKYRHWYPHELWRMDERFVGRKFSNWKELEIACNSDWEDGLAFYDDLRSQLDHHVINPPTSIQRTARWSEDDGDEVDLDRLRRGQPYWRASHRDHRPGPLSVTIVIDTAADKDVESIKLLWKGAAVACLTEILEKAGYRVEIWSICSMMGIFPKYDAAQISAVRIKSGMDMLNPSSLINSVSGWFFRTILFGSMFLIEDEHVPKDEPRCKHMGWCDSTPPLEIAKRLTEDEKVFVCGKKVDSDWSAKNWIQNSIDSIK